MECMHLMLHKELSGELFLWDFRFSWLYSVSLWGVMPASSSKTLVVNYEIEWDHTYPFSNMQMGCIRIKCKLKYLKSPYCDYFHLYTDFYLQHVATLWLHYHLFLSGVKLLVYLLSLHLDVIKELFLEHEHDQR
jgi:hypothetical protein